MMARFECVLEWLLADGSDDVSAQTIAIPAIAD